MWWMAMAMTVSWSLVKVKDAQRSFQASMKRVDGGDEDGDGGVVVATQAWLMMIEKKASPRLSQEPEVGVKCSTTSPTSTPRAGAVSPRSGVATSTSSSGPWL